MGQVEPGGAAVGVAAAPSSAARLPASASLSPWKRVQAILGGSAGNLVEWYDWFAYTSFALYFSKAFFPNGDQTAQLLQTAGVFALGFLARPVGAWVMGLYADRAGRKAALVLSVALMCLGSLIVALTPGYARIGAAAPIILTVARLLQGLSVGGEYGASATYMSEMAGKANRGFWSSFQFVTIVGGQLLALGVLIVLQHTLAKAQLEAWGWRIPFVIGAALAVVVFAIQRGLEETGSFEAVQAEREGRSATHHLVVRHPVETGMIFALTSAGSLAFYAFTTYMQKFLTNSGHFSKDQATEISAASLVAYLLVHPLFGWVGDRIGRRRLLVFAFGSLALATYPIMTALARATDPIAALALVCLALFCLAGYTAVNAVVKSELFPAHIRALGVALPYAVANAVFGGTAEGVALWLKQHHVESAFFVYVAALCAIAALTALRMRDTQRHSLILED
ncbi:MFS transporter [Caulobacter sp. KR2-114]|uniref:MFS transporter n=1 Tax=Caulobacter sp. KR2-114 TaxID=3400912 RepID=UPI003C06B4BD